MSGDDYHAFVGRVLAVVHDLMKKVDEFTVARVRWEFDRRKLEGAPADDAWAAAMKCAARRGLIELTDRTVKSTFPKTAHSRMVPVYRRASR